MRLMKRGMEGLQRLASRILYLILLLGVSWWVMTFTHETGHIIGGWLSGGTLKSGVLAASPRRSGNAETDENADQCFPQAEQSDGVEPSG